MNPEKFLLPEWAPQSAVMLTWPHPNTDWLDQLEQIESVFVHMVKEISQHEQLLIVCNSEIHRQHIANQLGHINPDRCIYVIADSDDSWCRDHGPVSIVEDGKIRLLNFQFNGWGNKFAAELDNAINHTCQQQSVFQVPMTTVDLVLEGGSIDTDGRGTLLTTEHCLLSATRNPGYSKTRLEHELQQLLGVQRILWLQHGALQGDDTDSHIDTLARFCNEDTIVYCQCNDKSDPHYEELQLMQQELACFTRDDGRPYNLVPLPLPVAVFDPQDGHRLPATYANFLIINDAVLVPVYNNPHDEQALRTLSNIFPDRRVTGIDCLPVIRQHGSLHCLTMQLPEGVLNSC